MATKAKGGFNKNQSLGYRSNSSDDSVDMGDDDKSDSLFLVLTVLLMCVLLLLLPLIAWMYVDIRMMEIRVEKAVKKVDNQ